MEGIKAGERIICAAIHFRDGKRYEHQPKNISSGIVICGRRHHNIFAIVHGLTPSEKRRDKFRDEEQGFLTSLDRFVDRKEGLEIALRANQIAKPERIRGNQLYSEDLY